MLGGHGQNYFNEVVALAVACVPVVLLAACLVVSLFERRLRLVSRFSRATDDCGRPLSVR